MSERLTVLGLRYFDVPESNAQYGTSRVAILPVLLERTVSYGRGTSAAPAAILAASQQVELYDEQSGTEPYTEGIATLPELALDAAEMEEVLDQLESAANSHMRAEKLLICLGGEHSLSIAPVRAAHSVHGEIGVVQFDAHADLRDEYEGSRWSHACIMRRVVELEIPTLSIGIRSLSGPEAQLIRDEQLPVVWGPQLAAFDREDLGRLLSAMPEKIYLTFDVDYFDPALVPSTGTPEPGGGRWYPTLGLLEEICTTKQIVGIDVVELSPKSDHSASDFLVARLIYKLIGFTAAPGQTRAPD